MSFSTSRSLFLQVNKSLKSVNGFQTSRNLKNDKLEPQGEEKKKYGYPLPDLPPLSGIHDRNFTKYFKEMILHPSLFLTSARNFADECTDFVQMKRREYNNMFILRDPTNHVDMLFTFEKNEDVDSFLVTADSTDNKGYSTASLCLTQDRTALFSGYLNTEPIKSGNAKVAGYATMRSPRKRAGFRFKGVYDWTSYTHFVFKIRGDGRTYLITLPLPLRYEEVQGLMYAQPLFTRGGPYWQIAKVPFSHFFLLNEGRIIDGQNKPAVLNQISTVGITAAGFDGHFRLEIEYIGLEFDPHHNPASPYEEYSK